MNCAKCFKAGVTVKLLPVPTTVKDHDKLKCPACKAVFFQPKPATIPA